MEVTLSHNVLDAGRSRDAGHVRFDPQASTLTLRYKSIDEEEFKRFLGDWYGTPCVSHIPSGFFLASARMLLNAIRCLAGRAS